MEREVKLKNGRKYLVIDTGEPWRSEIEYHYGGLMVKLWQKGKWIYLDNMRDEETLASFFKAAERLSPLLDQDD